MMLSHFDGKTDVNYLVCMKQFNVKTLLRREERIILCSMYFNILPPDVSIFFQTYILMVLCEKVAICCFIQILIKLWYTFTFNSGVRSIEYSHFLKWALIFIQKMSVFVSNRCGVVLFFMPFFTCLCSSTCALFITGAPSLHH